MATNTEKPAVARKRSPLPSQIEAPSEKSTAKAATPKSACKARSKPPVAPRPRSPAPTQADNAKATAEAATETPAVQKAAGAAGRKLSPSQGSIAPAKHACPGMEPNSSEVSEQGSKPDFKSLESSPLKKPGTSKPGQSRQARPAPASPIARAWGSDWHWFCVMYRDCDWRRRN